MKFKIESIRKITEGYFFRNINENDSAIIIDGGMD